MIPAPPDRMLDEVDVTVTRRIDEPLDVPVAAASRSGRATPFTEQLNRRERIGGVQVVTPFIDGG